VIDECEHTLITVHRVVDDCRVTYTDLVHNTRMEDYMSAERLAPGDIQRLEEWPIRLRHRWWERNPHRPEWDRAGQGRQP